MFAIVQTLGWPIWPLIIASVVALALVIERSFALRRGRVLPQNLLGDVLTLYSRRQISLDVIDKLEASSALGFLFAAGLRSAAAQREVTAKAVEIAGGHVAHELSRYLTLLGSIGSVAPLLGLLGTVVGMIDIFSSQQAGSNPQQLAQGISLALYSTAFGIIVAVPSVLAYRIFRARVDDFLVELEQQAQRLIEALYGEARAAARPGS
ncbi:MAG TPA: MotA/TolQ/ExbB proton channel family protein [Burkholderiaceae bacterium]|nr:MotA/TolQ/ExbB proton channel family protein [Burkholderiaceae bacterium]